MWIGQNDSKQLVHINGKEGLALNSNLVRCIYH